MWELRTKNVERLGKAFFLFFLKILFIHEREREREREREKYRQREQQAP